MEDDQNKQGHHHTRHHDVDQVVQDSPADVDGDHYLQVKNTSCNVLNKFQNYQDFVLRTMLTNEIEVCLAYSVIQ